MANAVINSGAYVGRHCIINSAAVVEHDNQISDFVHISVGAKVSGTVNGRVQAKKSIVVKKYIYEYLNTSAGNTITIRDIKKEKLVYAFATSLKLRNLN